MDMDNFPISRDHHIGYNKMLYILFKMYFNLYIWTELSCQRPRSMSNILSCVFLEEGKDSSQEVEVLGKGPGEK